MNARPERRWPTVVAPLAIAVGLLALLPRPARAFGEDGGFEPRALLTGDATTLAHPSALPKWSAELTSRTSAAAKARPGNVRADDPKVAFAPFLYWSQNKALAPLAPAEISGLQRFFSLGGLLVVDDAAPGPNGEPSPFAATARREIARVLPESAPIALGPEHVVFRSFYLVRRPEGRVAGGKTLDAVVRGGDVQVLYTSHDVGGALARSPNGVWEEAVSPGGEAQRDRAIRLAVNFAMYSLCSTYKDDQVHAPFLMRRRRAADP